MRFIYKLLIGLILFNAMLVIFSGFFPASNQASFAKNVTTDPAYASYSGNIDTSTFTNMMLRAGVSAGAVFTGALIIGLFTSSLPLWLGIGIIVSIFVGLWNASWTVVLGITNYPIVNDLVTVMSIIICLLVLLSIAEVLTAQRGAD
jgi:hypothetical protein